MTRAEPGLFALRLWRLDDGEEVDVNRFYLSGGPTQIYYDTIHLTSRARNRSSPAAGIYGLYCPKQFAQSVPQSMQFSTRASDDQSRRAVSR
jgi:hypothetical protein